MPSTHDSGQNQDKGIEREGVVRENIENSRKMLDEIFKDAPIENGVPVISLGKIEKILKSHGLKSATQSGDF